jgi:hypothetical protein
MKKHLIVIFFTFLGVNVNSQNYQELLKEGNKWNILCELLATCNCGEAKTYSLTLSNDTLIGELNYKKLMCKIIAIEDTTTVYVAAVREDVANQKVYVKYPDKDEQSLYDFNCQIGDTLFVKETLNDVWCNEKLIRFVKNVESYDIDGHAGKLITISDTLYRSCREHNYGEWVTVNTKYEVNTDGWYEGIGSLKSLIELEHIDNFASSVNALELLCFWNHNDLIYHHKYKSGCSYAFKFTGIEEIFHEKKISIYPNPTKGELTINTDLDISSIQIYDIKGNTIIKTKQKNINISNYSKGIYLVKIHTISNEIKEYKIIKE